MHFNTAAIENKVTGSAFSGCTQLTSVKLYGSASIGQKAFENCNSLNAVHAPDLSVWLQNQFAGSESNPLTVAHNLYIDGTLLEQLTLPNDLNGSYIFSGATCLKSISIPKSITEISNGMFKGCNNITDIYYAGSEEDWKKVSVYGDNGSLSSATVHYDSVLETVIVYKSGIEGAVTGMPENVKVKGACAVSKNVPESKGRIFKGWATSPNGEVVYLPEGDYVVEGYVTLYAVWEITYTPGNIDGDDEITDRDAIYLLYHIFYPDLYPISQPCDFNGDGEVNDKDAIYLLYHVFYPDLYPIR